MNAETGKQTPGDVGTNLAHQRTDLAMDRNFMAAERTLMAWIRTSLSMISFGFTIGKLGQILQDVEFKGILGNTRTVSIHNLAYILVLLGTFALLAASVQYWRRVQGLYGAGLSHKISITLIVALLLSAVGGYVLSSLVMAL